MTKAELGEIVKGRRNVLGLTTTQLSEYTGLSRTTISDIELGKTHPRLDIMNTIFEFLNLEMKVVIKK